MSIINLSCWEPIDYYSKKLDNSYYIYEVQDDITINYKVVSDENVIYADRVYNISIMQIETIMSTVIIKKITHYNKLSGKPLMIGSTLSIPVWCISKSYITH